MIKTKAYFIVSAALFLFFCINNAGFAVQDTAVKSRYPDYAYEFTGRDKCENFNRRIFIFNSKFNKCIVRPINTVWASVMPKYGMERVQNFYTNMEFPIRLMGCLLQKDFKATKTESVRFLTNTTLGVGGLYDVAKTRFKIEPCNEDMEQVLAHYKVKQGPYIVLPIVASGNVRDIAGQVLDCPLNPTSYIIGPVAMIAKSISLVNKTTSMQSLFKAINYTYADPYEITKKLQGVEKYIKNTNLDREDVFKAKTATQEIVKINNIPDKPTDEISLRTNLKADIQLENYNPQCPLVDALRTSMFDDKSLTDPTWSELSVWNRSFSKKIKTSSVNIEPNHPNYKYRYILQKNKTSPLAIIYPSIGEGIMSYHSVVLGKMFYDAGYSVLIQGSTFQWEFVKSMPDKFRPGVPPNDAHYARIVTSKIINNLQSKNACTFNKKVLLGTSFGALTTLFVASQEETENTLGITKYISICPPVEIFFAQRQFDKYAQDWKNNPGDIKMRAAIVAEKVLQATQNVSDKKTGKKPECMPFTEDEAKLVIGFIMQQKLSDLVFTIEKSPTCKKCDFYKSINNMNFDDYVQKYIQKHNQDPLDIAQNKAYEQLNYDTSLYSLANFLQTNKDYKIYHALDDFFVNSDQLSWLKKQTDEKAVYFSNGSHLGFLYRKEFTDELKKDISLQNSTPKSIDKPKI